MSLRDAIALGLSGLVGLGIASAAARADDDAERLEALERRVRDLEARAEHADDASWVADWADRVRLGGSANVGYFARRDFSPDDENAFEVWDARLFVDAELVEDVRLGERPLLRNVGFSFEWNLVRLGEIRNDVGELFVDFQGIGGSSWTNVQVGRFYIPVSESYLRYGKGYRDKPFITNSVGGPWWWDEGLRFYGQSRTGSLGYVASVSNGETPFESDQSTDPQGTLKLFGEPFPWLRLSVSGLISGEIGDEGSPAMGALWLGESWARAFGSGSAVPNFVDGAVVADGPDVLKRTWLLGGDVVLRLCDGGLRVWLSGGRYWIDSRGATLYDRALDYASAELVVEGRLAAPLLAPLYLGIRGDDLRSTDGSRGYLLDFRFADSLGYNMRSLSAISTVVGLRIGKHLTLRAEYRFQDVDVVRGVSPGIAAAADDGHGFALEVGGAF